METEEQIVYAILEVANKGTFSEDNKIGERLVKSLLRTYRNAALVKNTLDGVSMTEESYQELGPLLFTFKKTNQYDREIPATLRLKNNVGVYIEKNGESVAILNSESFSLSMKNIMFSKNPKAKFVGNKITIFTGVKYSKTCGKSPNNVVTNDFYDDTLQSSGRTITADVFAILVNPDHAPGYDWTTSPFPCPAELVKDIKNEILEREFNIILQVKADKITNGNDEETDQRQQRQQ